jgi:hypothetical protein
MPAPTNREAVVRWRANSLAILSGIRLELSAVEALVRAGVTGRCLEEAIEKA